jgi:hypothetical protein
MHSYHHNYAPLSFTGSWMTNSQRNGQRDLRNADDYHIPMAASNHLDRFPLFTLPREWNRAGPVKFHLNPLTFRMELKREPHR